LSANKYRLDRYVDGGQLAVAKQLPSQ